jgi:hypothetical protein
MGQLHAWATLLQNNTRHTLVRWLVGPDDGLNELGEENCSYPC